MQVDDAYWGGRCRGYKRGRGTRGKTPIVAAAQTDDAGRPARISLSRDKGFRSKEIARWSRERLAASATVHSDGLACFAAVSAAGCDHTPTLMSGPGSSRRRQTLNWVATMLGNVKNAIHGTYHAIRAKLICRATWPSSAVASIDNMNSPACSHGRPSPPPERRLCPTAS